MLSVKNLLGLECFRRITLEAGKGGLHRRISWPNIAQTASIREWLVGGDVILMSGVGLDHSADFLNDLIAQAVAGDAAGLIILLHRNLIPKIPPETIAYADAHGFPLFSAPWDLQLATLIGEVSTLILQDQYGENLMNELLEMLLFKRELIPGDLMTNLVEKHRLRGPHVVVATACSWENAGVDTPMRLAELPIRRQVNSMMIQTLKGAFLQTYYINRDWNLIFLIGIRPGQERQLGRLCMRFRAGRQRPTTACGCALEWGTFTAHRSCLPAAARRRPRPSACVERKTSRFSPTLGSSSCWQICPTSGVSVSMRPSSWRPCWSMTKNTTKTC